MEECPCKDCGKRYRACHDTCPDYKEWKSEQEKKKERERHEKICSLHFGKWYFKDGKWKNRYFETGGNS